MIVIFLFWRLGAGKQIEGGVGRWGKRDFGGDLREGQGSDGGGD